MVAAALLLLAGAWLALRRGALFAPAASPMRFRQVTFGPRSILHARFLRDGESVVYSARVGTGPHELFLARPGSPESRSLGISSADILSASASDDLALLLGPDRVLGTLGVVSLTGGVPREMLEKVSAADWLPDGKRLAVVRSVEGFDRLEFPIGKVVYRASSIGFCRVSRNGETVAILGPEGLLLVDGAGRRTALKAGRGGNFAWSPRGDEIWFDDPAGGLSDLRAVAPSGKTRFLASLPGDFVLMDVSADGRILLERGADANEPLGRLAGDSAERSLKWLDTTAPTDISQDGRSLLFNEFGPGMVSSDVYIRRGDSPPVRLGPGFGVALSPDGTWAVTKPDFGASRIDLVPTGPGTPKTLPGGGLTEVGWVNWLPDGERIVFGANAPNEKSRLYVQDISGGLPRPISPPGVHLGGSGGQVAPDGSVVAGRDEDGRVMLYPTTGDGPPRAIPGIQPDEVVKQWSEDGKSVYVKKPSGSTIAVFLLNLQSGERTLWKEFAISDPLRQFMNIALTRDGKSYVWTTVKWTSNLFVLSGIR